MKLIVGLGNPGNKYSETLHNIGFVVVDSLAQGVGATWSNFSKISQIGKLSQPSAILLKPATFMNNSGRSVKEIMDYFKVQTNDIWLVHDEIDLPPGEVRISFDSSSAGHRGAQSIIDYLDTQAFWRWRIGIGRPPEKMAVEDFVLTQPNSEIKSILNSSVIQAVDLLVTALKQDIETARLKTTKNKNAPLSGA